MLILLIFKMFFSKRAPVSCGNELIPTQKEKKRKKKRKKNGIVLMLSIDPMTAVGHQSSISISCFSIISKRTVDGFQLENLTIHTYNRLFHLTVLHSLIDP